MNDTFISVILGIGSTVGWGIGVESLPRVSTRSAPSFWSQLMDAVTIE